MKGQCNTMAKAVNQATIQYNGASCKSKVNTIQWQKKIRTRQTMMYKTQETNDRTMLISLKMEATSGVPERV
jgi:hypothetical protein